MYVHRPCNQYRQSKDPLVQTRAKRTLQNWNHLFTFLAHEGVEPTNNSPERAIRPAVQWRKICFGSQSVTGERFVERLLTIVRTCQMHGVNSFEFLAKLMSASFSGQRFLPSLPFLLPEWRTHPSTWVTNGDELIQSPLSFLHLLVGERLQILNGRS